jgi:hypothetical protein
MNRIHQRNTFPAQTITERNVGSSEGESEDKIIIKKKTFSTKKKTSKKEEY